MLNKEFILNRIKPVLNKNREISEIEFLDLFGNLTHIEQYEIINIFIENDIEYVDEKEDETNALNQIQHLQISSPVINYKRLKNITNEQLCVMAQEGNQSAMEALLDNNKRFVYKIALQISHSYKQNSLTIDDLFQEGNIGAMEAVQHFDVTKDNKFVTYSWHWIRQKIVRAIMDKGYLIRIPVHKFEKMIKVLNCRKNNIGASSKELSLILDGISEVEINELIIISENYLNTSSLNVLVGEDQTTELAELLPCNDNCTLEDTVIQKLLKLEIDTLLSILTDRERRIIEFRFGFVGGKEYTLEEIRQEFNVTCERIRQIETRALRKLRNHSRSKKTKECTTN